MKPKFQGISFYKMFLSYFSVFLIPTMVISFAIFHISSQILREEIKSNNLLSLQTAQYNLSKTIDSFSIVGNSISYSNFGHPIDLETENSTATQLISYLGRTNISYSFVHDIFFLYRDGKYIYSGQTSYTEENFYRSLSVPGYTTEELKQVFSTLTSPMLLTSVGIKGEEYFLYCVPSMRSGYSIGTLAFVIDQELFNHFLGNSDDGSFIYLLDYQGTVVNGEHLYYEELNRFLLNQSQEDWEYDGSMASARTPSFVFTAGSLIPEFLYLINVSSNEKALESLNRFRNLTLVLLGAAFVPGMICVLTAYHRNKKQLLGLTSFYEAQLLPVLPQRQKEVFFSLLEGSYLYYNDFIIQCEEAALSFNSKFHYCVIVQQSDTGLEIEHLISTLAHTVIPFEYSYRALKTSDRDVCFIGTNQVIPLDSCYYSTATFHLYISHPSENILDTHIQYADVLSLTYLEQFSQGTGALNSESSYTRRIQYYEARVSEVNACLASSDQANLRMLEHSLMADLKQDFIPFELKVKVLLQLFITFPGTYQAPFTIQDILALTSAEELAACIRDLFDTYLDSLLSEEETGTDLNVENIKEYIGEHFSDPMFSLQVLADHYHVSNSYLSWFFKQKTGGTVLDYTTKLKMDLATTLLKRNIPLQDVALQVGYINVNSFIRRFKQTMGMTPGEYRKG